MAYSGGYWRVLPGVLLLLVLWLGVATATTAAVLLAQRCAPRPNVSVSVSPLDRSGFGSLRVTFRAQSAPETQPLNQLQLVRLEWTSGSLGMVVTVGVARGLVPRLAVVRPGATPERARAGTSPAATWPESVMRMPSDPLVLQRELAHEVSSRRIVRRRCEQYAA